jgi:hypothetical protein
MEDIKVSEVYCLSIKEYTCEDYQEEDNLYVGPCCRGISAQEYITLKTNGVPTKEYTEVVFSKPDEMGNSFIRQLMFKHIAYVEKAAHTNF